MNVVVAVSGGVDSVVLLDMLANGRCPSLKVDSKKLIVAHFDHGIREDSSSDEAFVRGVAGKYSLRYESQRAELGAKASEEAARKARYNFLRQCCKKYKAQLIMAHHQDDLLETMIINLLRGTNWRGLVSLSSTGQIVRPLLDVPKSTLLEYARKYRLEWREDSTNHDPDYLRNYVRLHVLPLMQKNDVQAHTKLLGLHERTAKLKEEIATELQKFTIKYQISNIKYVMPRYDIIMLPLPVAFEVIYQVLTRLDPDWHPSKLQLKRSLHFIKTGLSHKELEISKHLKIGLTNREAQFKKI